MYKNTLHSLCLVQKQIKTLCIFHALGIKKRPIFKEGAACVLYAIGLSAQLPFQKEDEVSHDNHSV